MDSDQIKPLPLPPLAANACVPPGATEAVAGAMTIAAGGGGEELSPQAARRSKLAVTAQMVGERMNTPVLGTA